MAIECIQPPKPFQAEYEGSIPFTRSNVFIGLACEQFRSPTDRAEVLPTNDPGLFKTARIVDPLHSTSERSPTQALRPRLA
jgi:hypothetical protein